MDTDPAKFDSPDRFWLPRSTRAILGVEQEPQRYVRELGAERFVRVIRRPGQQLSHGDTRGDSDGFFGSLAGPKKPSKQD